MAEAVFQPDVCAVIVTYRYAGERLKELVLSLQNEIGRVFLIDNNPHPRLKQDARTWGGRHCRVIENGSNLGLAKALNQGLECALCENYRHILLLDQDSRPAPGMLGRLMEARRFVACGDNRSSIAAVGPWVMDANRNARLPFLRFETARVRKIYPAGPDSRPIAVDFLISSGALLNAAAVRDIGPMDERLFIDNVDLEWCFRAKNAGYDLWGVPGATLFHRLGDDIRRFPVGRHPILIHEPRRQYYIMRNRILLYRRDYVPLCWKIQDVPRMIFKLFFFSFLVAPRRQHARMMIEGLREALRGQATSPGMRSTARG